LLQLPLKTPAFLLPLLLNFNVMVQLPTIFSHPCYLPLTAFRGVGAVDATAVNAAVITAADVVAAAAASKAGKTAAVTKPRE
jgi:hypothetical protein